MRFWISVKIGPGIRSGWGFLNAVAPNSPESIPGKIAWWIGRVLGL
jgi:hypothetical protein